MDPLKFITSLPVFARLDPAALQALAEVLEAIRLPPGTALFQPGSGESLYIIVSGRLRLHLRQPDGSQISMRVLDPGECLGEMALLTSQPQAVTAATQGVAELLRLSKPAFDRLTADYPDLYTALADQQLPLFQQIQSSLILTGLFGQLEQAALHDLQEKLEWRRLDCGQVLFHQGDPGEAMYIVVQGRLRFAVEEAAGPRDLGEVGAGESIGEFALLAESGAPESLRSATVYATRLTDLVVITRPVFESLLCQHPQALLKLTRRIIRRELRLSQSVLPGAGALVITLLPVQPAQPLGDFAHQFVDAFASQGSSLLLDASCFEQMYGKPEAAQTPLDHPTSLVINAWLDERERQHQVVIYEASPALEPSGELTPWAQRCMEDADLILLVGEGGADPALGLVEKALPAAQTRARLELVLLHPAGCQLPTGTPAWLKPRRAGAFPIQAHHHVRLGHPADFRRLRRRVSGRPIGLALGGGGARGWAHIGVLRALQEAGLEVDLVGGASMGAIIAAGYALDWPIERMIELAAQFSNPKKLLDYTFPYAAVTSTRRITNLLRGLIGEVEIEDAWRPYFCVSANLTLGREQPHFSGTLWKAVRASMAFPAVFAPMLDEGCVLIDGGAANNVPVDRMREVCPTGTVIGVNLLTSSPTTGPYDFGPHLSGWQALLGRIFPFARQVKAPNLLDIVAGVVYSNNCYRLNEVQDCADLLIQVPVEAYGLLEFDKYAQVIELGYQAGVEALEGFKF